MVSGESDYGLPKTALKKIDKAFITHFPDQQIDTKRIQLTPEQQAKLSFDFKEENIYKLTSLENLKGYMYLAKARSKFDNFDFMVLFNADMTILASSVLVYREDYGGEIASKRWLKQFDNKSNGGQMEFGDDIQGISGATISCRSMTEGVKRVSKNIFELQEKGYLN